MRTDEGFSLIEALVAVTLLTVGVGALAQLSVVATRTNQRARIISTASLLALQKMEQLRGLDWAFDQRGFPVSDEESDTTVEPPALAGGTGLRASASSTLSANVAGYCDFLDESGRPLSGGASAPGTSYIRRWAIDRLPADPDTLSIQVLVTTVMLEGQVESAGLVSLRTRRGWE